MKTCPTCWSRVSRWAICSGVQPVAVDVEAGVDVENDGEEDELPAEDVAVGLITGADVGELQAARLSAVPAIVTIRTRPVTRRP